MTRFADAVMVAVNGFVLGASVTNQAGVVWTSAVIAAICGVVFIWRIARDL